MRYLIGILLVILTIGCNNDDDGTNTVAIPDTNGAAFSVSTQTFTETYNTIRDALNANENIQIIAEVDHTTNAQNAGLDLRNTRLLLFGNPNLGTPLMQINQTAGIDLPQKILVYEDANGNIFVAYNSAAYVVARHGVGEAETLAQIDNALQNFALLGSGGTVTVNTTTGLVEGEGISTITSTRDFETTYNRAHSLIEDNPNLSILAEVNHTANAQSVNLVLPPTRLLVFGNPSLGTPLLQNSQTTALELPQKMLVWEDENGTVYISYNDPQYVQQRHEITNNTDVLNQINTALAMIAENAAN